MKTQISILVCKESLWAKIKGLGLNSLRIFMKSKLEVYIDNEGNKRVLKASPEPYLIDLTPGYHRIAIIDPRAKAKSTYWAGGFAMFAAIGGMSEGSISNAIEYGESMYNSTKGSIKDNCIELEIKEGDIFKISAKANRKGSVDIKQLN